MKCLEHWTLVQKDRWATMPCDSASNPAGGTEWKQKKKKNQNSLILMLATAGETLTVENGGEKGCFIEKAAVYEGHERSPGSALHTDEHCPSEEQLWPQSQPGQRGLISHLAHTQFHLGPSATKAGSAEHSTAKQRANLTRQSGSPPRHLALHIVYWFLFRVIRSDWHSWLCLNQRVEGFGKRVSPVHSTSLCSATV